MTCESHSLSNSAKGAPRPFMSGLPRARAGRQSERLGGAELWVLPNPSGLNAHATTAALAAAYREAAVAAGLDVAPATYDRQPSAVDG